MRPGSRVLFVLCLGLLLTAGCQRLNFEKTYSLTIAFQEVSFDPPAYNQKLSVSVSPQKGPVSAWVVKTDEMEKVEQAIDANKAPPAGSVLGSRVSKDRAEEYTFEADVPAKTGYTLLLRAEKGNTDAKVKVVGR